MDFHDPTLDRPIRGQVRRAGFRRLSHGLYLPHRADQEGRDDFLRDLKAWQLVLPADAAFTHLTAAQLHGWWLPRLPRFVPVFSASHLTSNRPRRAGLICSRLDRDSEPVEVAGLPVDSAAEVLLRASRDLALLDLVPMVDSALRLRHVAPEDLERTCATTRPGVRMLRLAVRLADERSESAWESILRLLHVAAEIDVEPQKDLYDDNGRFVGRADLWVRGTRFVHEYDGADHDRPGRRVVDLRRGRGLNGGGFVRSGYVSDDLIHHFRSVLQEMDRELGRPHRPSRIERWRRWVAESSYSTAGRRRLQNRWLRLTGVTDWSQPA